MANSGQDFTGLQIPCAPGEFTPECLTAILRRSGVIQQSKVESVQVQEQSIGFVGQAAHLKLTYDREEPGAPSEIFAKLSSASAELRAKLNSMGVYETEAGFYREFSSEMQVRVPKAYCSHYDAETGECLLLLENIKDLRFGDNVAGSTLREARVVVTNLARMQARHWNDGRLNQCPWLRGDNTDCATVIGMYRGLLPEWERKWQGELSPELVRAARVFGACMESWFKNLGASPFTLTHGDFRPDNFAFHENGDVVLFDWQTARRGANTRDLSYFISFALPTALRRAHEGELLDLYHRTLVDNGVSDYTMDQLQKDFRRSIGSALMVGVIAGTLLDFSSERAVQLQRVLCERVSAVVKDHDFAEWLPAYLGIGSGEA
jgi:hypothetical protein